MGMSHEEFEKLLDEYIERGSEQPDELDADMFFDALADFVAAPTEVTIELEGKLHDGRLMLTSEGPMPADVRIYDNRITAPGFTFVIRLEQPTSPHGSPLEPIGQLSKNKACAFATSRALIALCHEIVLL